MEKNQHLQTMNITGTAPAQLLCFSHLKWDFVYQRPQHIMTRLAKQFTVYFVEEAIYHDGKDRYEISINSGVNVVKMWLSHSERVPAKVRQHLLLDKFIKENEITNFISWYYTPMALEFSLHLQPLITVYDCMDELSAFKFAPPQLKELEAVLLKRASLVFTGGHSLYEAKKHSHHNIFPFPSSIDKDHFMQARNLMPQPADQEIINGKKLGFYGVIDERFNINMLAAVAAQRPDWQLVLIGPVVKIEESSLPRLSNIHYLGSKTYDELPVYLSGWDIAMIPFEKNESTKFISPTKTPEYLAGGKPVISSSIADVVNPYAIKKLVHIADDAKSFIDAAENIFSEKTTDYNNWLERTDEFLSAISWDITVSNMTDRMNEAMKTTGQPSLAKTSFKSVA